MAGWGLWILVLILVQERTGADNRLREVRSQANARRLAQQAARALPRRMAAPDALQLAVPGERFELADGALVIPEDLGSLDPTPAVAPRSELDPLTAEALRRAESTVPPERAAALLEFVERRNLLPAAVRADTLARAAWVAQRNDRPDLRDAALERLLPEPEAPPETRLSATLLRFEAGLVPAHELDLARDLLRLPSPRAEAWLDRFAAAGLDGSPSTAAANAVHFGARRRATLRAVAPLVPTLLRARRFVAQRDGQALVLFDPLANQGARLPASRAAELASELLGTEVRARPGIDPDLPDAFDGLLAVATPEIEPTEPGTDLLGLLATPLTLLFLVSFFVTSRSVRREAEALRVQSEFLTTVTHELKTPLAGIRLATELLLDDHVTDPSARRDWLRRLDGEAARLGMLVENVLDLGRSEKGELLFDPREIDLTETVRDTLELFRPLADRDGLALRTTLPDEPVRVRAHAETLRQALLNVLDNARKYAADGKHLDVSLHVEGTEAVVTVRDHGPGIPASEREQIFHRFRRGSSHRAGQIPGVGLGLHLARVIAEQHSGSLRAVGPENDEPGVAFVFRIPLAEAWVEHG